jgi:hypothetical protein
LARERRRLPNPQLLIRPFVQREVANYVDALEYGIERPRTLPLSLRLV